MKIACVLYGQPRNYMRGYNNITNFFKNQSNVTVDFFYHCWVLNKDEMYAISPWRNIDRNDLIFKEDIVEHIKTLYNPICYEYENQNEVTFDHSKYINTMGYKNTIGSKATNINNTLYQIYSRDKGRKILDKYIKETNIQYDFVFTTRFDIEKLPTLELSKLDKTKTYIGDNHLPRNAFADNVIIAPTHIFLEWFDIYEKINIILDDVDLLNTIKSLGEAVSINPEELIGAKYILDYKTVDNIAYFSGGQ